MRKRRVRQIWSSPWTAGVALGSSVLLAATGFALLSARSAHPGTSRRYSPAPDQQAAVAAPASVSARLVCSFSNTDAQAAAIQGADGGQSVIAGGRTYWLFGDTLFLPRSGKQIEPNTIAWSSRDQPGRCPQLTYYARDGIGVPFIAKDGSLTVWPTGAFASSDHTFDIYTAYVYGSGPYDYWIGEVGLERIDTRTMQAQTLARRLWGAQSGFADLVIGAQPVDADAEGYLRIVLQTRQGDHLLARVRPGSATEAGAYQYWDGGSWSATPSAAVPLWQRPAATGPVGQLASFDNGANIAYNRYLRKYVAVQNAGIDKIGARVADRLEGPWSAPAVWLDCSVIARPAVPVCYSPFQHPQLASDGGRTIFITLTRMGNYDVVSYEITLDAAPGAAAGAKFSPGSQ